MTGSQIANSRLVAGFSPCRTIKVSALREGAILKGSRSRRICADQY
jgi:hypothetical protein